MANVRPFQCIRPDVKVVNRVAALPYDVYNRSEAKAEAEREPLSFLKIDRAETQFDDSVDTYDARVYAKAKELLDEMISNGTLVEDKDTCYYIYELTMNGRLQTGIVACSSVDDYLNNVIKKHENTREEKEIDRITHVDTCNAHTGPIFLAYRSNQVINEVVDDTKKQKALYDFTAVDGITHRVWKISEQDKVKKIKEAFEKIDQIYIADGHHRAASAVKVGMKRRKENPDYTGEEEYNYFLSVLFPDDQLMIMDYNRSVKDLNGYTTEEFLEKVKENFTVTSYGTEPVKPKEKGSFGMYFDHTWYLCKADKRILEEKDPVLALDVSILQNYLLGPILGIEDPRTDQRIDFIGGIRGLSELEKRAESDMYLSFSMYPTSILELFSVADDNKLMPPKSTWFEPKLRSGIFIHRL